MKSKLVLFLLLSFSVSLFAQEVKIGSSIPTYWKTLTPYQSEKGVEKKSLELIHESIKNYGIKQPNIFLSVDPLADSYPGITPYHYSLNNPVRFIDPNGMWVAEYDEDGNIVNAVYENGDIYEGLYSQLGISAELFSEQFDVDLSAGITKTSFNITSYVLKNTNITPGSVGNANCVSFVLNATGFEIPQAISVNIGGEVFNFPAEESAIIDENFGSTLQIKYGYSSVSKLGVGDVAVFSGNYKNNPNNSIHTGIYIIKNQAGDPQYISRNGQGAPVSISTMTDYRNLYINATPSVQIQSINYFRK